MNKYLAHVGLLATAAASAAGTAAVIGVTAAWLYGRHYTVIGHGQAWQVASAALVASLIGAGFYQLLTDLVLDGVNCRLAEAATGIPSLPPEVEATDEMTQVTESNATRLIPIYTVTWPTRPGGVRTLFVRAARSPEAAARKARTGWRRVFLHWTTSRGYGIAFDLEPEVWRVDLNGARYVAGPHYTREALAELATRPVPQSPTVDAEGRVRVAVDEV